MTNTNLNQLNVHSSRLPYIEDMSVLWLQEPQQAFHSRIAFCLNTHNEAVKALRFPPDAHKKELESAEKRRERQQQEQELAKHIAEEDDDEF